MSRFISLSSTQQNASSGPCSCVSVELPCAPGQYAAGASPLMAAAIVSFAPCRGFFHHLYELCRKRRSCLYRRELLHRRSRLQGFPRHSARAASNVEELRTPSISGIIKSSGSWMALDCRQARPGRHGRWWPRLPGKPIFSMVCRITSRMSASSSTSRTEPSRRSKQRASVPSAARARSTGLACDINRTERKRRCHGPELLVTITTGMSQRSGRRP